MLSPCIACRSQQKEEVIKETVKEKRKQGKKLESTLKEQTAKKLMESKKSVEVWKIKKDEKISAEGLYTYTMQQQEAIHGLSWCPARTLHNYSKNTERHRSKPDHSPDMKENSYGLSFESETSSSHHSSDQGSSESSASSSVLTGSVSRTESPSKGAHKNIQVCCQTLHYWCTCEQQQQYNS